jgi:predicted nucleic acid-binding protein
LKTYFLDTSAIGRLYLLEEGWGFVRDLVRAAIAEPPTVRLCACDLALPETVSAVQQAAHGPDAAKRGISRSALRHTLPKVRADLGRGTPLVLLSASNCMPLAAEIVERQQVRGADAVHIAAALNARKAAGLEAVFAFVSNDKKQCRAAALEGLEVLTPA